MRLPTAIWRLRAPISRTLNSGLANWASCRCWHDAAIVRLIGALVIEESEEWHITRRYMSQESLAKIMTPETKLMIN